MLSFLVFLITAFFVLFAVILVLEWIGSAFTGAGGGSVNADLGPPAKKIPMREVWITIGIIAGLLFGMTILLNVIKGG